MKMISIQCQDKLVKKKNQRRQTIKQQPKAQSVDNRLVNSIALAVPTDVSIFLRSEAEDAARNMVDVFAASPFFSLGSGYTLKNLTINLQRSRAEAKKVRITKRKGKPLYEMLFKRNDVTYSKRFRIDYDKTTKTAPENGSLLDRTWLEDSFAKPALPVVIDIGCAKGSWALKYATQHQELNVLGLEIRADAVQLAMSRKTRLGGAAKCPSIAVTGP
eukprot:gnl/TRDRNA2_/TRDRNA2_167219_c1_seq4.p1 gnl/TRDRNA2_/TRDRNA2_167219_c1~~gnl/TRDRNA2_/TRDRNA2_167219_c1_seq4.p1  ORF type:complete len:217 (-),score=37.98 gnl/TRDRNA2_/TRDRNA2_167219_c1_seq4:65-715(-)